VLVRDHTKKHPEAYSYWLEPYHSWSGRQRRNHRSCWDKCICTGTAAMKCDAS